MAEQGTWRDWLPPGASPDPPTITRDQLLERLKARGIDLPERTLRSWEHAGVLPRAVVRRLGTTPHAFYPAGYEDIVENMHHWRNAPRNQRRPLRELGPAARSLFSTFAARWGVAVQVQWGLDPGLPRYITDALKDYVASLDSGAAIARVVVKIVNRDGEEVEHHAIEFVP